MNAIEFLIRQHRETEDLLSRVASASSEQAELVVELARKLSAHMELEEEVFYPAVYEVDSEEVHHATEEHEEAKIILDKLMDMEVDDERFAATLKDLKEKIMHHVKEEERDLFPKVRREISAEELEDLYYEMEDLLEEIEDQHPGQKSA